MTFDQISRTVNAHKDFPYFYILYKRYRQFERATGRYTVPLWHHSPGFATMCFPSLDDRIYNNPIDYVSELGLWPHDSLHGRIHIEADSIMALQSIGNNVGNWLRDGGTGASHYDQANQVIFGGYEDSSYTPEQDSFMDISGWEPIKGKLL
jgi:hypothetical protein